MFFFSAMEVRSVYVIQAFIQEEPIIFCRHFLKSRFLSHILSFEKLIAKYRPENLTSTVVSYVALREVVCLSEPHRGFNFSDVICARRHTNSLLCYTLTGSSL